jgi:hypothetical protein
MANDYRERSAMPREGRYVLCPECGAEVYEGEVLYRFKSGKRGEEDICGRCLAEAVAGLPPEELAWLAGARPRRVSFARRAAPFGAEGEEL